MQESKKRGRSPVLKFEAGRVFTPAEAKAEDLQLDLEAARFKARKGEAGTRFGGGGYCANCGLSLAACRCGRHSATSPSGYPVMNRAKAPRK
jgi:hypothetical protein